jgi:hypothetical protein
VARHPGLLDGLKLVGAVRDTQRVKSRREKRAGRIETSEAARITL